MLALRISRLERQIINIYVRRFIALNAETAQKMSFNGRQIMSAPVSKFFEIVIFIRNALDYDIDIDDMRKRIITGGKIGSSMSRRSAHTRGNDKNEQIQSNAQAKAAPMIRSAK